MNVFYFLGYLLFCLLVSHYISEIYRENCSYPTDKAGSSRYHGSLEFNCSFFAFISIGLGAYEEEAFLIFIGFGLLGIVYKRYINNKIKDES